MDPAIANQLAVSQHAAQQANNTGSRGGTKEDAAMEILIDHFDTLKIWLTKINSDMNGNLDQDKWDEWVEEFQTTEYLENFASYFNEFLVGTDPKKQICDDLMDLYNGCDEEDQKQIGGDLLEKLAGFYQYIEDGFLWPEEAQKLKEYKKWKNQGAERNHKALYNMRVQSRAKEDLLKGQEFEGYWTTQGRYGILSYIHD